MASKRLLLQAGALTGALALTLTGCGGDSTDTPAAPAGGAAATGGTGGGNVGPDGPIAILNHREEVDAEVGLKQNIDGLKALLVETKDEAALKTYGR